MAAVSISRVSITAPKNFAIAIAIANTTTESSSSKFQLIRVPWAWRRRRRCRMYVAAVPDKLSEKVEESIKNAQEACSEDPVSGECKAAWDEVEELSAAASHARDKDKQKEADPLENYCNDNPETDECRTYDN